MAPDTEDTSPKDLAPSICIEAVMEIPIDDNEYFDIATSDANVQTNIACDPSTTFVPITDVDSLLDAALSQVSAEVTLQVRNFMRDHPVGGRCNNGDVADDCDGSDEKMDHVITDTHNPGILDNDDLPYHDDHDDSHDETLVAQRACLRVRSAAFCLDMAIYLECERLLARDSPNEDLGKLACLPWRFTERYCLGSLVSHTIDGAIGIWYDFPYTYRDAKRKAGDAVGLWHEPLAAGETFSWQSWDSDLHRSFLRKWGKPPAMSQTPAKRIDSAPYPKEWGHPAIVAEFEEDVRFAEVLAMRLCQHPQ